MPSFLELDLPAPLAEAIAAKGYEQATPVQAAVAAPENRGRDLLVSSQTGSGKTLAFGVALAPRLLGERPAPAAGTAGDRHRTPGPIALVIAPTRELATQVSVELGWLYARSKVKIVSFTGGTDVRRDLYQLRGGADLAVGTPGRLVDLVTRGNLDLSSVQSVVLDEADEMLDMGFRDDLEALLGKATARTQTLMFSATLPQLILSMAARYQKDAVRINARAPGSSTGANEDIQHVAHLVAVGDKLPAVLNVLRKHGEGRAIVFGQTREGVASLHRELLRRGLTAVVLSGDRAQAERTRSLDAVKKGEARILVATNVAARGLDLPEVDLVIHADLPLNAEDLTHRSGRTGRAGRKGTSVVIATATERRKAERLLSSARVAYQWTPAPGAEEITAQAMANLEAELRAAVVVPVAAVVEAPEASPTDAPVSSSTKRKQSQAAYALRKAEAGRLRAEAFAARLLAELSPEALVTALVGRELSRMPEGESLKPVEVQRPRGAATARDAAPARQGAAGYDEGPQRTRSDFSRDAVVYEVNLGARDKAEPGWMLPLICRRGGITRRDVGAIRIGPTHTEFEISAEASGDFLAAASQSDPRAPHIVIARRGAGAPARPARPARPPRPAAPEHDLAPPDKAPEPKAEIHTDPKPLNRSEGKASFGPDKPVPAPKARSFAAKPSFEGGAKPPSFTGRKPTFSPGEKTAFAPRDKPSFAPRDKPAFAPRDKPGLSGPRDPFAARPPGPKKPFSPSPGGGERTAFSPRPKTGHGSAPTRPANARPSPFAPRSVTGKPPRGKGPG